MMQHIIEIKNGIPRHPQYRMKEPVNFVMDTAEQIAVVGPNGGGKSLFVDILIGKWPLLMNEVKYNFPSSVSSLVCDNIKYLAFRDSYGDSDGNYYYQQRWNSQDLEKTPYVYELLPKIEDENFKELLFNLFEIKAMLNKHIVLLSSGELRKFQLVKVLSGNPKIVILDNPFIGLDEKTRLSLRELLHRLIKFTHLQLILVLPKPEDIPDFITHVLHIENCTCGKKIPLSVYLSTITLFKGKALCVEKEKRLMQLPNHTIKSHIDHIVCLNKVNIQYGDHVLLKELDWIVKRGEKWALTGENGSGKSTLLSLICADNPQSYACDISLFGQKRGTGESIWDIKKRIGFVSPEMHRAYLKNIPAIDIVASGLNDTVGLYKRPLPEQMEICEWWMDIFGILKFKDKNFLQLSSGEQRLVLLARAFVKDPDLLILDEPFHGLDMYNSQLVNDIITAFCNRKDKTLIMVTHYKDEFPQCITHSLSLKKN